MMETITITRLTAFIAMAFSFGGGFVIACAIWIGVAEIARRNERQLRSELLGKEC